MARQDMAIEVFEEELIEAWRNMAALPDRERSFLRSGQRSWWPSIVRDRLTDYADAEAAPRRQLSRREMRVLGALFVDPDCLCLIVPVERRALVAQVLTRKAWPQGRALWDRVWDDMGGRACGATSDTLRSRYEAQLRRLALAWMARREAGAGA